MLLSQPHLANVLFNWSEMEFPFLRLIAFLILTGVDTGVAIYYRYLDVDTKVSYVAHLAGAIVGLLLGIVVLKKLACTYLGESGLVVCTVDVPGTLFGCNCVERSAYWVGLKSSL